MYTTDNRAKPTIDLEPHATYYVVKYQGSYVTHDTNSRVIIQVVLTAPMVHVGRAEIVRCGFVDKLRLI